jgi:translation elongation factor aEF-1 beta
MGIVISKIRIMPEGLETDLEELKTQAREIVSSKKGFNISFEEQEIAFGLKAIIVKFDLNENEDMDTIEEALKAIPKVSSIDIIDFRRALA